ncbi:CDP-glycerol glycerophosphotransferase family protein [Aliarcobacter cryaerophilus]|uniref:CDP-glycerol glycerophosphotransferase family protein n=1 Tax=Aliarcobacter cryaerophilus TaxID=28198 RepID=UPI0021B51413|nr:CDP-glycerol glycerophosphotransferase family protein [Aliarcobacter cryaerophilus]MCT7471121.1 CDP-glycerol glycerophosphotransferase family protein [Aliarcobacter cryaerophilus]
MKSKLKNLVKASLTENQKKQIRRIKFNYYDTPKKKKFVKNIQNKHAMLLKEKRNKKKIKVIFLAIHKSVWKVDLVFKKMLKDSSFEPIILVCPYTPYGTENMLEGLAETLEHFKSKNYPVISSYVNNTWVKLEELKPDMIFFTNPHSLTISEYYENAYENYLCAYVPYYFMATTHAGDNESLYNTYMLNAMKYIFWPHEYVYESFKKYSLINGENSICCGYPASEIFFNETPIKKEVWKKQSNNKKRIIYAPHHTIDDSEKSLSSFLQLGESIKQLAQKYSDEIQWAFKPHPILKQKLYLHKEWGKVKTDDYWNFWDIQEYTQLETGEYEALFMDSDAIIHDSSSFIVEYAFLKKPALYTVDIEKINILVNEFGKVVLKNYEIGNQKKDVVKFLNSLLSSTNIKKGLSEFDEYVEKYYKSKSPSSIIIEHIKNDFNKNQVQKDS